jgi:hypothetical protein
MAKLVRWGHDPPLGRKYNYAFYECSYELFVLPSVSGHTTYFLSHTYKYGYHTCCPLSVATRPTSYRIHTSTDDMTRAALCQWPHDSYLSSLSAVWLPNIMYWFVILPQWRQKKAYSVEGRKLLSCLKTDYCISLSICALVCWRNSNAN